MPSAPSSRRSLLHCFARGSFALGSKLFSGLAVQTLGICLLGAGLGNRFLVGLAHLSHRRGLTCWRLCKGRSRTHHKRQERCANEASRFSMIGILHSRTIQSLTPKSASIRTSSFQLFITWSFPAPIFYLVAARQFIQAHDLHLFRFLHGLHLNSDNSANVGSRPLGVSLSTSPGRT